MSEHRNIRTALGGFAPRGVRGLIGLSVIAVLAFLLGGILFGGGDEPPASERSSHDHSAVASPEPTTWTCSMHPQIKLPKPGKCPICFMDLIPLESDTDDELGPRQLRLSETAKQLAQIQTTPAKRAFAEAHVRMVGKITYDETKLAYITAWVPGRLDRLYADFTGITVSKGDHLVDIYSPELLAAQEELIQARTAVRALGNTASVVLQSTAKATVEAARDKLRLFGLAPKQIESIEYTQKTSDHLTIYAPIGGVVVHKDAKEGMYVSTGSRIYTIADLTKLWVTLEAYESDLPWLCLGQRLEFTSPSFPGAHVEAIISFIDPLVDPKTRTVKVRAVVENKDRRLKPDMFVRGVVKSRIDSEGNIIDEYLADKWISPMHPEIVKSGPGKCDVCGMDLVPAASLGYVGKALDDHDAPLLIPASSPLITGKRAVVYVEIPSDDGPLFEGREIELGPRAGDFYIIKDGIEEGELVVTNGAFKIDSELQIRAKPSMMSPTGGATMAGHQHGGSAVYATHETAIEHYKEEGKAREALTPLYAAYFDVQMALAKDELEDTRSAGKELSAAIKNVDMSVFSRKGHSRWMELSKKLSPQANRISTAENIKIARDAFFYLSEATIGLHQSFGHATDHDFYLTHCPMARDGDGAYWLQKEDVVWNSFYGRSMLRCGSIKTTQSPGSEGKK
ncbi:MAG: efflux RND transporter periplasmic adaptor subunit [Candidatus Krumholzibacteria bacterium]|nr:efflux RND transporter periplasmic adaptor subunit [Candidatus Krumholzibacteria bacterium]